MNYFIFTSSKCFLLLQANQVKTESSTRIKTATTIAMAIFVDSAAGFFVVGKPVNKALPVFKNPVIAYHG
jgi:hypothetical protein